MDPDRAAPIGAVWSASTIFVKRLQNCSANNKNIHLFVIGALKVNACEVRAYMVWTFMKCPHVFTSQKAYYIKPEFYSLVNETAEPRPDMHI